MGFKIGPCGWLTNVVTQKFGILAMSSDLFWKNGWRSLLYFCSTFKISSLACSFNLWKATEAALNKCIRCALTNDTSEALVSLPVDFILYFINVFNCLLLLFF